MRIKLVILFFALMLAGRQSGIAQKITGQVFEINGKPLPFATIKFGKTGKGMIADLEGKFAFNQNTEFETIEVSYLNFETKNIPLQHDSAFAIFLSPLPSNLKDVVIHAKSNKLKRILNAVVDHRNQNNPDKYDWYQCKVYYKMVVDVHLDTTDARKDSAQKDLAVIFNEQPAFVTETYSKRTWQRPQQLQEEVMATKMSGLKKAIAPTLVTDILPFHAYTPFIKLNEKDYYNPIMPGLFQRFDFKLKDEIRRGTDTLWIISFTPKQEQQLSGTLYISSNQYAIAHLIAHSIDTVLHKDIGVEQQYMFVKGKWFPQQLNFTSAVMVKMPAIKFAIKGNSQIDSVSFEPDANFHFDKAHTIIVQPGADEKKDSSWAFIRPVELNGKEQQTYAFMDSLFEATGLQKLFNTGATLQEGRIPWKKIDFDIDRFYSNNSYEGTRLGLGIQTNQKLWKHFSAGGWAGYGLKDKLWKYGAFSEIYFDPPRKEFVVRGEYFNDVRPPGQQQFFSGYSNTLLRQLQVLGVDKRVGWRAAVQKKFGYLSTGFQYTHENDDPRYAYQFLNAGKNYHSFQSNQFNLSLRYAFGERTAPVYGRYSPSAMPKYPVLNLGLTRGTLIDPAIRYTQVEAGISYTVHLNRIGEENILVSAAQSFSDQPLPVQKLFAGNAFSSGTYNFGNMQTMPAGQYFSDKFLNVYWLHKFDFRFYTWHNKNKLIGSQPSPAFAYNMLWGTLKHPEAQQLLTIKIPDPAYHEGGILINNILRTKIFGLAYLGLNGGYFHQLSKNSTNGKFVIGIQVDF